MKEHSSTLVFLFFAFSLFSYQVTGRASCETEQVNLTDKFFSDCAEKYQRLPTEQAGAPKQFLRDIFCHLSKFDPFERF